MLTERSEEEGSVGDWEDGQRFPLSAPILSVSVADLGDKAKLDALQIVFQQWVRWDRRNGRPEGNGAFEAAQARAL